jgi:transcriptional regulator with XRE-family HTH domain
MERIRKADPVALRAIREDRWLTQEALAEKAGVTTTTISLIETGHHLNPRMKTLEALASALECHPSDLLEENKSARVSRIDTLRSEPLDGAAWDRRLGGPDRENGGGNPAEGAWVAPKSASDGAH